MRKRALIAGMLLMSAPTCWRSGTLLRIQMYPAATSVGRNAPVKKPVKSFEENIPRYA